MTPKPASVLIPVLCLGFALAGSPRDLAARTQSPAAASPDSSMAPCATGPISFIFVDNRSIFDTTDPELDDRFRPLYQLANTLHVTTDASVIRRELLFREGDCYDEARLAESERLLRGLDFLAQVDIYGIPQEDGSYHVVVDTQDEWSTRARVKVGVRDRRPELRGARLRESNLVGTGQAAELFYLEEEEVREYGLQFMSPQLLGTRLDFLARIARTRDGTSMDQVLAYPFVGEYGRWAFRQALRSRTDVYNYVVGSEPDLRLLVPVRQYAGELIALRRFGEPGRLLTLGGGITFQELHYSDPPREVFASDYSAAAASDAARLDLVTGQRHPVDNVRAVVMIGVRRVGWVQRRGLDTVRGLQDVALGRQIQLTLGRTIPGLSRDEDVFAALSLAGATEVRSLLLTGQLWADARRDLRAPAQITAWEDLTADAELRAYLRLGGPSTNTLVFSAEGTGAWHTRTPFQLTLGGRDGIHGYAQDRFPGGRRVVVTLEDRVYFGSILAGLADLGASVFADAGRVWAGDVPFGQDSGWRASIGVGLRGAFPSGSRKTYRLDLAIPIERGPQWDGLRVTLSMNDGRGLGVGSVSSASRLAGARYEVQSLEFLRLPD